MRSPLYPFISKYGTTLALTPRNKAGTLVMKNAQESGYFEGIDEIKPETLYENYVVRDKACFGCANHCRSWFEIKEGPYAGLKGVGVEVATVESWAALFDNPYAPSIYKATVLCNQFGLDSSECGQLIALATEWYQKGIITKKDLEGIDLDWGKHEVYMAMISKIANREGIGALLAEDAVRAAQKLGKGAEKCITHCKGVLKTNLDLRAMPTYAFGHAVSTRGADHLRNAIPSVIPPGQYEGVAREVFNNTYACTIADALEVCKFHTGFGGMEMTLSDMAELFSAATGIKVDEEKIRVIADRIWTLERAFIVREGITRKDDILIGRFMDEPVYGGPWDGMAFDRDKWDEMLDEYYDLVGWDKETGIPTRDKLEAVGLTDVADELEMRGNCRVDVKITKKLNNKSTAK
jgi:aldehyde:ferredoxin oxidoreductase